MGSRNVFPNPFSDQTTISFQAPHDERVLIEVYDLQGTLIQRLYNDHAVGNQPLSLTFRPESNTKLFLCKVISGNRIETQRLYLNK